MTECIHQPIYTSSLSHIFIMYNCGIKITVMSFILISLVTGYKLEVIGFFIGSHLPQRCESCGPAAAFMGQLSLFCYVPCKCRGKLATPSLLLHFQMCPCLYRNQKYNLPLSLPLILLPGLEINGSCDSKCYLSSHFCHLTHPLVEKSCFILQMR